MSNIRTIKQSPHEIITNSIIGAMESALANNDTVPARWINSSSNGLPRNYVGKNIYNGVNILVLWCAAMEHGYQSLSWLTYKQAIEIGAQVRKGEKGTQIVYYSPLIVKDKASGENKSIPMLKTFTVFNVAQCDGIPEPAQVESKFVDLPLCADILAASGAVINHCGNKAFYRPSSDEITLPPKDTFSTADFYYATAFHELTHWTGAEKRLNRVKGKKFGDDAYAFEELVAELGAAFVCADLGIVQTTMLDHACYLASWVKVLKSDNKAIFTASTQASAAYNFIVDAVNANPVQLAA